MGGVAHMVERSLCMREVLGSMPSISIPVPVLAQLVEHSTVVV